MPVKARSSDKYGTSCNCKLVGKCTFSPHSEAMLPNETETSSIVTEIVQGLCIVGI